jgi:hypothetical protein
MAKKEGIFRKTKVSSPILLPETWIHWENHYKTILESNHTVRALSPSSVLSGVTEESGRITFNAVRTKKEFSQLSYIIPPMVTEENMELLPSLASILPGAEKKNLILHPEQEHEEDIDTLQILFDNIKETSEPVYGLCILYGENVIAHGIAYIAWKDTRKQKHVAFYDPLSYRRKRTQEDGTIYYDNYNYAIDVLKWVRSKSSTSERKELSSLLRPREFKFSIYDLSDYCIRKNEEEFDCPQYQMNAEYCYFFSLHFLYIWASLGKPITQEGFQTAIQRSYIIPMEKLTRAYTLDTLRYRITMMSFIVTVFTKYFMSLDKEEKALLPDYQKYKTHLEKLREYWYRTYGISLVCN